MVEQTITVIKTGLDFIVGAVTFGGGFWALWGVIQVASGLRDKNGPDLQSGIWRIVGGVLIIAAARLFSQIPFPSIE